MPGLGALLLALALAMAAILWQTGAAAADEGDDLINELRCPAAARYMPLAASDTPEARWMKAFIRAKVAEGWPRQRIVDTLVRQYGEGILPAPAKEGFGLAAWVTPFAIIFGGAAVTGYLMVGWLKRRRWNDAYWNAELAREIDDTDLQRYEEQLRRELEQFN